MQFPEAPASWNTHYVHPSGFECQITLRAECGLDLMDKVDAATAYLIINGCEPYLYRLSGSRNPRKTSYTAVGDVMDDLMTPVDLELPIHQEQNQ